MPIQSHLTMRPSFRCQVCGRTVSGVGSAIGVCAQCLVRRWEESRSVVDGVHGHWRQCFGLPETAPRTSGGVACDLCSHECRMAPGERSYCGIREGYTQSLCDDGRIRARLSYYHDPIPTNCVADWVCPGGTGAGYPRFTHDQGPEVGYYNLAVFFEACNFDCLYCQNWSFRRGISSEDRWVRVEDLLAAVTEKTSCICFFGGDPIPQLPFALVFARRALASRKNSILRICWETNGSAHPQWLMKMAELSLATGGCIKVDLKAWNPNIHHALCGCDNKRVLENFVMLSEFMAHRPDPPFLVASTLLVPGYVDEREVAKIAAFLAELHPDIPYCLLAFAPHFCFKDFPTTSRFQAEACVEAARRSGLRRVRLANRHLLS